MIRRFGAAYVQSRGDRLLPGEERALQDLLACRTSRLGYHAGECLDCGKQQISYNSCRNRHCPKCQGAARASWLAARQAELLPVSYFHVVFTLPPEIARLALGNRRVLYDLLFQCASETLLEVAADPKHLGAQLGVLAVLHTWGQNLDHHPHVHCVVPGGGLSEDESRWVACRKNFFLPVKVLSRKFRGKFLAHLKAAHAAGKLKFAGSLAPLAHPAAFARLLTQAYGREWVVYSKPPFGGPQQTLKYLARYTHRVAISNARLLDVSDSGVTFSYKDYAAGGKRKTMTLSGVEFLRRFFTHLLPKGYVHIRSYGLLANRHRRQKLELCREILSEQRRGEEPDLVARQDEIPQAKHEDTAEPELCCRCCGGPLRTLEHRPRPTRELLLTSSWPWNTS